MECPKCQYDLSKLENYDNIYRYHKCPNCDVDLYLDYDHIYIEEENEVWDLYDWIVKEEKEVNND